jgi:uncharacterized phosphosugar-binding protein
MSAEVYIAEVKKLIDIAEKTQMEKIHQVADLATDAFINNNLVYVFGTGHSTIMAIEVFARAGGLFHMQAIFDEGMAFPQVHAGRVLLRDCPGMWLHHRDYDTPGDVDRCFKSGRNPAPVQMAGKQKIRAVVVALTSLQHSTSVPSNDPLEKNCMRSLTFPDNGCPAGMQLRMPGLLYGLAKFNCFGGDDPDAIVAQTAKNLLDRGIVPPVAMSGNLPEGKEYNKQFLSLRERFSKKLRHR